MTGPSGPITTLFFDIGGVLLTNGWDRHARRHCIDSFELDWEEFRDRHDFVAHDFETGRLSLRDYLERTVFYRERSFTEDDFITGMRAQSEALPGSLELLAELHRAGYVLVTLNNESRSLNEYRIERFGLRRYFSTFLSSCYLGVKKPEPEIYRLALDLTQRSPEECLFVDDRALNLECARDEGLDGVQFTGVDQLRSALQERGVSTS